jgi:hypothetical protein
MLRAADLGVGPQADRGGRRRRCARHRVKCVPVSATTGTRFCVSPRRSAVQPHFTSSTFADRFSACAARRATDFLLRRMVLMSPFLGRRRKRGELKPAYSLRPAGSSRAVARKAPSSARSAHTTKKPVFIGGLRPRGGHGRQAQAGHVPPFDEHLGTVRFPVNLSR